MNANSHLEGHTGPRLKIDCLFCKIADKAIPSEIVHEDDQCVAIKDKFPQAKVHCLVIPKRHIPTVNDMTDAEIKAVADYVAGLR